MVTLEYDIPLHPNKEIQLSMLVTEEQTGKPVKDLQPYLGALAHTVIISQDGSEFLHTHPIEHAIADHGHHLRLVRKSRRKHNKNIKMLPRRLRTCVKYKTHLLISLIIAQKVGLLLIVQY